MITKIYNKSNNNSMTDLMSEIKVTYDPRGRSVEIADRGHVSKVCILDLIRIFLLIQMGTLKDMLSDEIKEVIVKIKECKNNPLDFLYLTEKKNQRRNGEITLKMKKDLWNKYHGNNFDGQCYTCGCTIDAMEFQAAHVKADSKGGKVEIKNLRTCCKKCNDKNGNLNLYTFILLERKDCPGRANMDKYFEQNPEEQSDRRCTFLEPKILNKSICFLRETAFVNTESEDIWNMTKNELISLLYSPKVKASVSLREVGIKSPHKSVHIIVNGLCEYVNDIKILPGTKLIVNGKNYNKPYFTTFSDMIRQKVPMTFKGHTDKINAYVHSNNTIITASDDMTLKIWNLEGTCLLTLQGHTDRVKCVAVISNNRIISGSHDKTLKVWNRFTGECEFTLSGHTRNINSINVLCDGRILSEALNDVKVWDLHRRVCDYTLIQQIDCLKHFIILNGDKAIFPSVDRKLRIWDLKKGVCVFEFTDSFMLNKWLGISRGEIIIGGKRNIHWSNRLDESTIIFEGKGLQVRMTKDQRICITNI